MLAAATLVSGACSNKLSTEAGRGTLAVQLTDGPFLIDAVESVDIFVVRVDARRADADAAIVATGVSDDSADTGGWTTIATPNSRVNLLAYQNGTSLPLGLSNVATGNYLALRIIIDPTRSSLTLKNGAVLSGASRPNVSFPAADRSAIKIALTQPVVVVDGDTTTMLLDFMVGDSFVLRGNTIAQQGLLYEPVVRATVLP
jgi:hypothetical protein